MAYNTFRSKDMEAERELAKFLDKHLYTKEIFTRSDRTDNAFTQIDGSDIIISIPSLGIKDAIVDEKASIYYINKDLRTFVLEISFLNRDYQIQKGWFVNDQLSTQYYLMQWIKANVADPRQVKEGNITEIECVLVSKKKLKDYFEREGYDKTHVRGSVTYDENFNGCPHCGAKSFYICNRCGKVVCYHGQEMVTCPNCGRSSTLQASESVDLSGGGF